MQILFKDRLLLLVVFFFFWERGILVVGQDWIVEVEIELQVLKFTSGIRGDLVRLKDLAADDLFMFSLLGLDETRWLWFALLVLVFLGTNWSLFLLDMDD